jgi:hypothetical protein
MNGSRTFAWLFLFACALSAHQVSADQISLTDGRIFRGKVIDKTETKYIIEKQRDDSPVSELVEINIRDVSSIKEELPPPVVPAADNALPETGIADEGDDIEGWAARIDKAKSLALEKRDALKEFLIPYLDKASEGKNIPQIDFIREYIAELVLIVAGFFILLFFTSMIPKKKKVKREKNEEIAPGFQTKPFKDKKVFRNIAIPGVTFYYHVPQSAPFYYEAVCRFIDTESCSVIAKERLAEGTLLKIIIIREKKLGRNVIKEDATLSADVTSVKDAPVKGHFEVFLKFQHLFLTQRAFISKILAQGQAQGG